MHSPHPFRRPVMPLWILLALATGCEDYTHPTGSTLPDDTASAAWHGVYEGSGRFTSTGYGITGLPVDCTLRVTDLGENYVRVALYIDDAPAAYTPGLRIEGVVSDGACAFHQYDDLFKHFVQLSRSGDRIGGLMGVSDAGGSPYWFIDSFVALSRDGR